MTDGAKQEALMPQRCARHGKRLAVRPLKPGRRFDRPIDLLAAKSTASQRSTDAQTGLARQFDADKVQRQISAQTQITQTFSQEAPKAMASYAQSQYDQLRASHPEEANKWAEGGVYRIALHTAAGPLGGGLSGAAGAAASASAAPLMNDLQGSLAQGLQTAGLSAAAAKAAAQTVAGLTAAGVGAAVGGAYGAAAAATVDANNRQLHETEAQKLASAKQGKTAEEQRRLDAAACALVRCADGIPDSDPDWKKLNDLQSKGDTYTAEKATLQKTGEFVYEPYLDAARDKLTRHGEAVTRVGGAINLGAGAVGTVGGGAIAAGGAVSCVETLGLGCLAVPFGLGIAVGSSQQMQQGNAALLGTYQSSEAQRVLDSFNPATYPGERDPLLMIGIDAAKFGLAYAGGKYIPRALAKAEGLGSGGATGSGAARAKGGVTVGDEAAALNRIGGNANGPVLNGKAPNTVLNQQMVNDLKAGQLPGKPIGRPGTPREMPSSPNPSAMAEDFALRALGREPTQAELAKGLTMNGGNCPGCWSAKAADGTSVTYRPGGNASSGTLDTTASVGLNSPSIKALNAGKPELKLKFPGVPTP